MATSSILARTISFSLARSEIFSDLPKGRCIRERFRTKRRFKLRREIKLRSKNYFEKRRAFGLRGIKKKKKKRQRTASIKFVASASRRGNSLVVFTSWRVVAHCLPRPGGFGAYLGRGCVSFLPPRSLAILSGINCPPQPPAPRAKVSRYRLMRATATKMDSWRLSAA